MAEIKAKKVLFKNRDGESLIPYIGEDYVKNDDMVEINMREVPCIVETYVNGTSWYRVYSDGWCEQYAERGAVAKDATLDITLLKPYKDTNYKIFDTSYFTASTGNPRSACGYSNKTTSSFTLLQDTYTDDGGNWYTCGYIA